MITTNFGGYEKPKLIEKLRAWISRRAGEGGEPCIDATHMVVVADDLEGIVVYFVRPSEDVRIVIQKFRASRVEEVLEIYSYRLDLEIQLSEPRAYHP